MHERLPPALKRRLSGFGELDQTQEITPALSIEEFFDGNEDLGSIGCNLDPHPGIERFRSVFEQILNRTDVADVRLPVTEFIEGLDWPFVDNVIVVTAVDAEDIFHACVELNPDEAWVIDRAELGRYDGLVVPKGMKAVNVWWD